MVEKVGSVRSSPPPDPDVTTPDNESRAASCNGCVGWILCGRRTEASHVLLGDKAGEPQNAGGAPATCNTSRCLSRLAEQARSGARGTIELIEEGLQESGGCTPNETNQKEHQSHRASHKAPRECNAWRKMCAVSAHPRPQYD